MSGIQIVKWLLTVKYFQNGVGRERIRQTSYGIKYVQELILTEVFVPIVQSSTCLHNIGFVPVAKK